MLSKGLKFLHEVAAIGVLGSLAASIVLIATAPDPQTSLAGYAAVRSGIAAISHWLLVPSLALVLISGLLSIAANRAYMNAAWAWIKALLGISLFEGSLIAIDGSARNAADLAALAAQGQNTSAQLAGVLRTEWGSLWLIAGVAVLNIILAVWRPRIYRRAE
jgi:hypothetical protein